MKKLESHSATSEHVPAFELLKQNPFNFVDFGKHRGGMPAEFQAPKDRTHWNDALACMAVLRSKPANWQWTAERIRKIGGLSDRCVRRGMSRLKEQGWVQHVNVYDRQSKILGTFILVFSTPIPEEKRKNRYSMILTENGWVFRAPGEGYKRVTSSEAGHKNSSSKTSEVPVHPPYEHYSSEERTQTLKRAETSFSSEAEGEKDDSSTDLEINQRKHLIKRLRQLGEKKERSTDDLLAYEEFVTETFFPALDLPPLPEEGRRRTKRWMLRWVQENLLGMLLMEMSSSTSWDVTCARRVVRRSNDGYINLPDLRVLLMAFRWETRRSSRRNLRAMTHFGSYQDPMNMGETRHRDAWGEMIKSHRTNYEGSVVGTLKSDCQQIHPDDVGEFSVNDWVRRQINDNIKQIFTRKVEPDEKVAFCHGATDTDAISYMLSFKERSEKTQKLIEEAHDELVRWLATDYTGVLIFRDHVGRLEEAMGIDPKEVREEHHRHIDKLARRANCHGLESRDLVPLI